MIVAHPGHLLYYCSGETTLSKKFLRHFGNESTLKGTNMLPFGVNSFHLRMGLNMQKSKLEKLTEETQKTPQSRSTHNLPMIPKELGENEKQKKYKTIATGETTNAQMWKSINIVSL